MHNKVMPLGCYIEGEMFLKLLENCDQANLKLAACFLIPFNVGTVRINN